MSASRASVHLFRLSLVLVMLLGSCTGLPSKKESLPALMVERLQWMDEVAMVKQAKSLPITDAKREAELLADMEKQGAKQGLPAAAVRALFAGQIDAAKVYQKEWMANHPPGPPLMKKLPDLAGTVRPALDALGQKMLTALKKARKSGNGALVVQEVRQELAAAGFSPAVIRPAVDGLAAALDQAQ